MAVDTCLPSTDPYAMGGSMDNPDTLADKPSTTPLMTSGGGWVRFLAMLGLAAYFVHGKHAAHGSAKIEPFFGGQHFPPEIKIHGSHQHLLGGGVAPFGALAVYTKMTPARVTSPPSDAWAGLDRYAKVAPGERSTDGDIIGALATATVEKSLLVQFSEGHAPSTSLDLERNLLASLGAAGAAAVQSALASAVEDGAAPPAPGAQLYMTCVGPQVHFAYGEPAEAGSKHVRNTAPVTTSLKDDYYAHGARVGVCQALFEATLGSGAGAIAAGAGAGVAAGFIAQYGPADEGAETAHEEL